MTAFAFNLSLTLVWLALTGELTPGNFILGFTLSYFVLRLARRMLPDTAYFGKISQVLKFAIFFLWELLKANLRVAYDVVTPRHHMRPGVVGIPLDATRDEEITLLAVLLTLTPGTLALDVSADRRTLYVHAMYIDDLTMFRVRVKEGLERRIMELLR